MSNPVKLHPKVRERKSARISASALAEFIIAPPDRQDGVLHDQRYSSAFVTPKHQQALRIIRSYCSDQGRNKSIFDGGREALVQKSKSDTFSPSQRDEAARCVETLDLFRSHERNVLGVAGQAFLETPDFDIMTINGLPVSLYPDLVAGLSYPPEAGKKVGLIFIRAQKRPDPSDCKTQSTKAARQNHRREVLSYMMVLGDMMLRANGLMSDQIDRHKFRGWDLRLGEEVAFPTDRVSREKRISAACGQIIRLWGSIRTKPSDLA